MLYIVFQTLSKWAMFLRFINVIIFICCIFFQYYIVQYKRTFQISLSASFFSMLVFINQDFGTHFYEKIQVLLELNVSQLELKKCVSVV